MMAGSLLAQAHATLAVQNTQLAVERVSRKLDVLRAEIEDRRSSVPKMIRTPNDLAANILGERQSGSLSRQIYWR
jgi:hypothetical protein